jgi:hypothetical protein
MPKLRPTLFKWRHFEPEIIICAVRWSYGPKYSSGAEIISKQAAEALAATDILATRFHPSKLSARVA